MARASRDAGLAAARKACHTASQSHPLDTDRHRTRVPVEEVCELTKIDPWFIHQIQEIIQTNRRAAGVTVETASKELLREVKRIGTSDETLAQIWKTTPAVGAVAARRVMALAPFSSAWTPVPPNLSPSLPYMYSTYEEEDESEPTQSKRS